MAACLQHVTTKESLECFFINFDLGEIALSISGLQLRQYVYICVRQGRRMECDCSVSGRCQERVALGLNIG